MYSALGRARGVGGTTLAGSIHLTSGPAAGGTLCGSRAGVPIEAPFDPGAEDVAALSAADCVSSSGIGVGRRSSGIGVGRGLSAGAMVAPGGREPRATPPAGVPFAAVDAPVVGSGRRAAAFAAFSFIARVNASASGITFGMTPVIPSARSRFPRPCPSLRRVA